MDRFLALQTKPDSKAPPIEKFLEAMSKEKINQAFVEIADKLHDAKSLNPTYSLVSLRRIVELSPLLRDDLAEDALNPVNSYRWLYLIHALASRVLTPDEELEKAKVEFVMNSYVKFVQKADFKAPFTVQFLTGLFCAMARLADYSNSVAGLVATDEVYNRLLNLLETKEFQNPTIDLQAFEVQDLFKFGSPMSLEYLPPANLFGDTKLMIHMAVLRLLYRICEAKLPTKVDQFKEAIYPLAVKGISIDCGRRALVKLFNGDEDAACVFTDTRQYQACAAYIGTIAKKSNKFETILIYQDLIGLSDKLNHILRVASEHPKQWVDFLAKSDIRNDLQSLLTSQYDIDFVTLAVSLLRIGNAELADYLYPLKLLVTSRSVALRDELSGLLLQRPEGVANSILGIFPLVCNYGSRSSVFFDFLGKLLPKVSNSRAIVEALIDSLKSENDTLSQLSNSHIYSDLSHYITVSGSYLDPQPCTVCNNPERVPTEMSISRVKEFMKYQPDIVLVKLKQALTIQSFSLEIPPGRSTRRFPRVVKVFVSTADITEGSMLVTDAPKWRHVADITFAKDTNSASVNLPLHTYATCIKYHITDVWEDTSSMSYHCPSCRSEIPDPRSGTCPRCGDNCYQCKNCRHIDYNALHSLICVECGASPLGQLNWSIMAVPSFSHTHIQSEDDCDAALKKCDELLADAHETYEKLRTLRSEIDGILSPAFTGGLNVKASQLNNLYNNKCKSHFQSLTQSVQHVCAIRNAVAKYKNRVSRKEESEERNICYSCRSTYIKNCLGFLVTVLKCTELTNLDVVPLLFSFLYEDSVFTSTAVDSLVAFCSLQWELTVRIVDIFRNSLPDVSPHVVRLICELEKLEDDRRASRLPFFIKAIEDSLNFTTSSAAFIPTVFQPLVEAVCSSPLLIRTHDKLCMNKALTAFGRLLKGHERTPRMVDVYDVLLSKDLAPKLLFECPSAAVRASIADLEVVAANLGHFDEVSSLIVGHVMKSNNFGKYDEQCYSILCSLLSSNSSFLRATMRSGFFDHVVKIFEDEVDKVMANEENIVLNLKIGFETLQLMKVIRSYLNDTTRIMYVINHKEDLIRRLMMSYFKLRSLFIQRSKHIEDTLSELKEIIFLTMNNEFVFPGDTEDESAKPSTHHPARREVTSDDEAPQPIGAVSPVRASAHQAEPEQQEDDTLSIPNIKGPRIMLSAGAESIQFCPDIVVREISGIIFPPPVFLNVPIIMQKAQTQEEFMPGRLPNQPVMSHGIGVVFRDIKNRMCIDVGMVGFIDDDFGMELIVLNNIISLDLAIDEVYKRIWEPEQGDSPMVVTCRIKGLDGEATEPIITSFPRESTTEVPPEVKYQYTTVLCDKGFKEMLAVIDREDLSEKGLEELIKLLQCFIQVKKNLQAIVALGGVDRMFDVMKQIISTASPELFINVIAVAKTLMLEDKEIKSLDEKIAFIFEAMKTPLMRNNENTVFAAFLGLIPPIAAAKESIMKSVLEFFVGVLKTGGQDVNMFAHVESPYMLNGFSEFTLGLPENNIIRDLILKEPFVHDAIAFLVSLFPLTEEKSSKKWQDSLEKECLPSLLKILAGMVMCHEPTQRLFLDNDAHLLRLLLQLETVTSKASIGDYASAVIANASKEPSICVQVIHDIKESQAAVARRRAEQERQKAIQDNSGISDKYLKMMEELDEQEWACCICREGYEYFPNELLGVYVYANRMGEFVNTATYFVCVHPSCHAKVKPERPRRGQPPITEWEAAKVRNSERPCNAIFPLPSKSISIDMYRQAVTDFLNQFKPRGKVDYFRMVMLDMLQHVRIISKGEKIAIDAGGGSLESIVRLWPFLITAGESVLVPGSSTIDRLQSLLDSGENPFEAAIMSIWLFTLDEWQAMSRMILKSLIKANASGDGDEKQAKAQQAALFYIVVDRIHQLTKGPSGVNPTVRENGIVQLRPDAAPLNDFMQNAFEDGPGVAADFASFAEELEDEIIVTDSLRDTLIRAGVTEGQEEFINEALQ